MGQIAKEKNHTYTGNTRHWRFHELGFLFAWSGQNVWVLLDSEEENILILFLSYHVFKPSIGMNFKIPSAYLEFPQEKEHNSCEVSEWHQ